MTTIRYLILALALPLFSAGAGASAPQVNIAFYYGSEAPIGSLMAYDWIVLQQDQASDARIDLLTQAKTLPLAYVSVGEMARSHRRFSHLQPSWVIGKNPAWSSAVLDLRLAEVRAFLLDQLIDPAFARGFKGVFLDTLDSFELAPKGAEQTAAFVDALALESWRTGYNAGKGSYYQVSDTDRQWLNWPASCAPTALCPGWPTPS